VASASHNTNHARAMGSSRSNSATSSGVSGGGAGGGNILAAQLADPAANAKTKRDFERRGGLPTAVSTSIFCKERRSLVPLLHPVSSMKLSADEPSP